MRGWAFLGAFSVRGALVAGKARQKVLVYG